MITKHLVFMGFFMLKLLLLIIFSAFFVVLKVESIMPFHVYKTLDFEVCYVRIPFVSKLLVVLDGNDYKTPYFNFKIL